MSTGSDLEEEAGIAERLAEGQRAISVAEFFEKNKHMLGFDSNARALVTAVKEGVDNALDAAEEAGILPDIYVDISDNGEYFTLIIEDNGPGITKEQVPKIFGKMLYGSRFHRRQQARGQQGLGISAAVLYAQLTSGNPARITSRPKGHDRAQYFEVVIDTDVNEPDIRTAESTTWDRAHGTRIEIDLEANVRARGQLHAYIEQTAVVNPHARIELREPRLETPRKFERATDELPAETSEIKPHPHGVDLGTLIKMLAATDSYSVSGFLQQEFTRVGKKTAESIIDEFRDEHFGRELTWQPPSGTRRDQLESAMLEAIANKPKQLKHDYVDAVSEALCSRGRVGYSSITAIVAEEAEQLESTTDRRIGETVRDNVITAAWDIIVDSDSEYEHLRDDLYSLIRDATSNRKSAEARRTITDSILDRIVAKDRPTHRFRKTEIETIVDEAATHTEETVGVAFGETARENIIEAIWTAMERVDQAVPTVSTIADNRDMAASLLAGMRRANIMAPPTDCLAPITEELIEKGLKKEYDAEFYAASTRDAGVHGGDPFVVEAGIAYGGALEKESSVSMLRFANRVPLVYQQGACAITDVVSSIDWRNYNLDQPGGSGIPGGPAVIMVHVASTNVPFTSESKDAVANIPEIEHEIELAVRDVGRSLKSHISQQRSLRQRREKEDVIARILPEMVTKVATVVNRPEPNIDATLARIMNNVHVVREISSDNGESTVTLTVRNFNSTVATPEITDIVTTEPTSVTDDARVVQMDDEYYLQWNPTVSDGESVSITYRLSNETTSELAVSGIPTEKLTVDVQ